MAAPESSAAPRSPSPTAPAPTQTTPGPRAAALFDVYQKALQATLRSCSYENFAACFPTPAQQTPRVLRAVWEQIVGKIESKGQSEFEQICKERDVVPGLNALETLIGEARGRKEAGVDGKGTTPQELPPSDLLAAHLAPHLQAIQAQLQAQLRASQARNAELAAAITTQRAEMQRIVGGLEATIQDLEGANGVLEEAVGASGEEGGVRAEARGLRAELAGREEEEMKT